MGLYGTGTRAGATVVAEMLIKYITLVPYFGFFGSFLGPA